MSAEGLPQKPCKKLDEAARYYLALLFGQARFLVECLLNSNLICCIV